MNTRGQVDWLRNYGMILEQRATAMREKAKLCYTVADELEATP